MSIMTEAVQKARFVVCFSQANKDRTLTLWPDIDASRLKVIPQAVETNISRAQLENFISLPSILEIISNSSNDTSSIVGSVDPRLGEPIVFVFVGGIRRVKNPLFLVSTFQEWHSRDSRIIYLIIGPRLDKEFACDVFEPVVRSSPGVLYVPGLPISDVHSLVAEATALVNTSDSEGMCLALLEAMQLGTPVLARDVPGNRAIIQDGHTGLLFDSPKRFLEKAQLMLDKPELRSHMTRKASDYIDKHHSLEGERQEYSRLLEQCLRDLHRLRQEARLGGNSSNNNNNNTKTVCNDAAVSSGLSNCGSSAVIKICGISEDKDIS